MWMEYWNEWRYRSAWRECEILKPIIMWNRPHFILSIHFFYPLRLLQFLRSPDLHRSFRFSISSLIHVIDVTYFIRFVHCIYSIIVHFYFTSFAPWAFITPFTYFACITPFTPVIHALHSLHISISLTPLFLFTSFTYESHFSFVFHFSSGIHFIRTF